MSKLKKYIYLDWNVIQYMKHEQIVEGKFDAIKFKSFIQSLDYIDYVTDFSLLRIAPQRDGLFILDDTAAPDPSGKLNHHFTPTYPWSTAVPIRHHYLQTTELHRQIRAERTGMDELEVGSTFIISE